MFAFVARIRRFFRPTIADHMATAARIVAETPPGVACIHRALTFRPESRSGAFVIYTLTHRNRFNSLDFARGHMLLTDVADFPAAFRSLVEQVHRDADPLVAIRSRNTPLLPDDN